MSPTSSASTGQSRKFQFFYPILSGASLGDRLWACLGALVAICLTSLICGLVFGHSASLPYIVAPMGASAVLLFAVPASPLAQPWPVIGGNTISAFAGVAALHLVNDPVYAIGIAVGLAILAMSFTRSLHPPGGAAALTAVIGGAAVRDAGFWFPLVPVAINSIALVGLGVIFHKLLRHNYPHRAALAAVNVHKTTDKPAPERIGFSVADIDGAIADLHETLDIDRNDIDALLRRVEQRALARTHGDITCSDIMSRDVVAVQKNVEPENVRLLLSEHHLRSLPVVDDTDGLLGAIGLDELEAFRNGKALPLATPAMAHPADPAISLLPILTNGHTHNVLIVDDRKHLLGVVSQTDLLVALGKNLLWHMPTPA